MKISLLITVGPSPEDNDPTRPVVYRMDYESSDPPRITVDGNDDWELVQHAAQPLKGIVDAVYGTAVEESAE